MSVLPDKHHTVPRRFAPLQRPDTRVRRGWLAALAQAAVLCGILSASQATFGADKITERAKQKLLAESERTDLRQKLGTLKRDIAQTETAKDSAADALEEAESAISNASRSLRSLSAEQTQTETRLQQLSQQQNQLTKTVQAEQTQLAQLLREQYTAGNEDRTKLLLSGDNPNRINRELQYMGYLSQAQARLVESLRVNLKAVEVNQAAAKNAKDELDEIAQEEREQKVLLEKEKIRRTQLLAQLSSKLVTQRKQADNLERNDQRLAGLVTKLAQLIAAQKKADAIAQEKRHQEQLAARAKTERLRAERLRQQALQNKKNTRRKAATEKNQAISAEADDAAPPLIESPVRNELTPDASTHEGAFAKMRGRLRLPIPGELIVKFGSKRGEGPSSKGLFIRAGEGLEVKAVAAGRVIFADWLRGFGNLIIVDHGSQYMTIYGNNQTLFKRPGDAVKSGDTISSAGNSGGGEQSGLYFEMRHQGRAFDPLGWVTIR
ncbi:MAG: peptidoglycan DD-metalloendopeptidase family protein [Oxalobacteraceae bacterium]|nr:peptidoglycan DD-metalloendopeptidase family protein [Oxalobacteraceae bacterium]